MWDSNHKLFVHVFHDQLTSTIAGTDLDAQLAEIRDLIVSGNLILEPTDPFYKFFRAKNTLSKKSGCTVKYNQAEINRIKTYSGWMVVASNHVSNTKKAMAIYRAKDLIENNYYMNKKLFYIDQINQYISTSAEQNIDFIVFISLILTSHISRLMAENNIFDNMAIKNVFKILDDHTVLFINNDKILKKSSTLQKKIYSAFGLPIPKDRF
ncbi:MAG: hypothetical protein LBT40_02305 [Deltaproteobacteria bacterium]|jgi:hypothetical protein|nr:hypothetical protein [Deltaproteobacteria bacterium]